MPVRWLSEITEWDPPDGFCDVQRKGPYRLWAHRHTFEEVEGGTLVTDSVDYRVPGGALVNRLFVAGELRRDIRLQEGQAAGHLRLTPGQTLTRDGERLDTATSPCNIPSTGVWLHGHQSCGKCVQYFSIA